MSYTVLVLPEAEQDADRIYRWIAKQSPVGADRWYEQFLTALRQLSSGADQWPLAPENAHVVPEIRQLLFKTKNGRRYRVLFLIAAPAVHVLHVRGPGQQLLGPSDLRELD